MGSNIEPGFGIDRLFFLVSTMFRALSPLFSSGILLQGDVLPSGTCGLVGFPHFRRDRMHAREDSPSLVVLRFLFRPRNQDGCWCVHVSSQECRIREASTARYATLLGLRMRSTHAGRECIHLLCPESRSAANDITRNLVSQFTRFGGPKTHQASGRSGHVPDE